MISDESFEFDFESDAELFDPLSDGGIEDEDLDAPVESGNAPADPEDFPSIESLAENSEQIEQLPSEQRTAILLDQMQGQRSVLLPILDFCREKHADSDVVNLIETLQHDNRSVYSPENICLLLKRAGAIERVDNDGEYIGDTLVEPNRVVVDGVEYYEPAPVIDAFWLTTDAGREALDAYKPADLIRETLKSEPAYSGFYRQILEAASNEAGTTRVDLSSAFNNKPVVESPRLYIEHFIDQLAKAGAIEWKDRAWRISDAGKSGLDILDEVESDASDDAPGEADEAVIPDEADKTDAPGEAGGTGR